MTRLVAAAQQVRRETASTSIRRRARQLREDEIEILISHYREHGSVAAAANALGITRLATGVHLANAGIATIRHMTETEVARARKAHKAGDSATRIGRDLGFSPHTILRAIRD